MTDYDVSEMTTKDVVDLWKERDELLIALDEIVQEAEQVNGNEYFPFAPLEKAQEVLYKYKWGKEDER